MLAEVSDTLEALVLDVIERMNAGQKLDAIVREVHVAPERLERPWLRPMYDEPEFLVRNVWRLWGGWWDGNPANLEPAPDARPHAELAAPCGGADALARRAHVWQMRRDAETSLIAKGIYGSTATASRARPAD